MNGFDYKVIDDKLEIKVSTKIYPLLSIKMASSNFLEYAYIALEEKKDTCIISIKKVDSAMSDDDIVGKLYNELLRESIRYDISKETKTIRELIVGRSLYSTCIEDESDELTENPIIEKVNENKEYDIDNIAVSWFDEQ